MKKTLLEQANEWITVTKAKASQYLSDANYEVKNEGGVWMIRKKAAAAPTPVKPEPAKPEPAKPTSSTLQDYVGQYKTSGGSTIDATLVNGKIHIKVDDPTLDTDLVDKGNDNFEFKAYGHDGTCVGKREGGKIVSVTISLIGKTFVAVKSGSSSNANPPVQNTGQSNYQQYDSSDGWANCVGPNNEAKTAFIVIDKSNNKPFGYSYDKPGADKIKTDNPSKNLDIVQEDVRVMGINCDFNKRHEQPEGCEVLFRKNMSFLSNSSVKRGTYRCVRVENDNYVQFMQRDSVINESKLKKIVRKNLINLFK